MALDDLLISTGVDQLIRLVRERGRIEIGEAGRELKLPVRMVEDWARVLESEGLVQIEYRLTKIYLVWKSGGQPSAVSKPEAAGAEANRAREEVGRLLSRVEKGGSELSGLKQEVERLS